MSALPYISLSNKYLDNGFIEAEGDGNEELYEKLNLDRDITWYLLPLFIENFDEGCLEGIIEELISDLPESQRDDKHRSALRIVKLIYDETTHHTEKSIVNTSKLVID